MNGTRIGSKAAGGFTLIELMIVVAIIGILASLALSQYQAYTTRAKIMEIIMLARRDVDLLREYFHLYGALPDNPSDAGVAVTADKSRYLSGDVLIAWNGTEATVSYPLDLGGDAVGTLLYTGTQRGSDLDFQCSTPDFPARYLPPNCR